MPVSGLSGGRSIQSQGFRNYPWQMRDFLEYAITVEMIAIATKPRPQDAIRDQPLIDTASRGTL